MRPATAPATRPDARRLARLPGRAATMYPPARGGMASIRRPSVSTSVIMFRSAKASTIPTAVTYSTTTPATAPTLTAWRRLSTEVRMSAALRAPEDAIRPEDEHQHQDAEGDHVAELVGRRHAQSGEEQVGAHRLQDPQDQPADHGADDAADSPEHRGGEGLDPRQEAHEPVHLAEHDRKQDAGRAGKDTADSKGDADDAVDVDPHQRRRILVLADGAHRAPGTCPLHEPVENDHERGGSHDDDGMHAEDLERSAFEEVTLEDVQPRVGA